MIYVYFTSKNYDIESSYSLHIAKVQTWSKYSHTTRQHGDIRTRWSLKGSILTLVFPLFDMLVAHHSSLVQHMAIVKQKTFASENWLMKRNGSTLSLVFNLHSYVIQI